MAHPAITNLVTGFVIGYLTRSNVLMGHMLEKDANYPFKAPWTPPGAVFGIAWTILYILTGIVQQKIGSEHKGLFRLHFVVQNLWPIFFFGLHLYVSSVGVLAATLILSLAIFSIIPNARKGLQAMWGIYILWLVFAFSLNIYSSAYAYMAGIGLFESVSYIRQRF
jgi:benzodiazapine receptor